MKIRLTKGIIVDTEHVTDHPGLMRVKGFGAFENGALVRSWFCQMKRSRCF
jgi:hypothetical protein